LNGGSTVNTFQP